MELQGIILYLKQEARNLRQGNEADVLAYNGSGISPIPAIRKRSQNIHRLDECLKLLEQITRENK